MKSCNLLVFAVVSATRNWKATGFGGRASCFLVGWTPPTDEGCLPRTASFFSHLPVPRGGCFCAHRQASKHAEHTCCACAQSRRPPVAGVSVLAEGPSATTQAHARAQTQRQTDGRAGGRTDKPTGKQASRRAGQTWGGKNCAFSCRPCRPRCRPLRKFLSSPAGPFLKRNKKSFP